MKRTYTFLSAVVLALATSSVFAHDWDGNPDMQQSILNDHTSGFVGTGLSASKLERGGADNYGSILLDVQAGDIRPAAAAEKGIGDSYGSILNDL